MRFLMGEIQHYLRFRVGQEWYGVDIGSVIEVLHFMALTELPDSPYDVHFHQVWDFVSEKGSFVTDSSFPIFLDTVLWFLFAETVS